MILFLTPELKADITEAETLPDEVDPEAFIADKAYAADSLTEKRGITPVILFKEKPYLSTKNPFPNL